MPFQWHQINFYFTLTNPYYYLKPFPKYLLIFHDDHWLSNNFINYLPNSRHLIDLNLWQFELSNLHFNFVVVSKIHPDFSKVYQYLYNSQLNFLLFFQFL
jgi:hypothetical protein